MQSRNIPQEPIYLLDPKAPLLSESLHCEARLNTEAWRRTGRLGYVDDSGKHITGKKEGQSNSNGVAEQEKGVNVVRFQDGIAQVLQRPIEQGFARHLQDSYWHLL
jgi:hypothetical protein